MKVTIAFESLSAVALQTALKYRRGWNKNSPTVKLLQSMMPEGGKKGYRLYIPIEQSKHRHFTIPPAVKNALKKAGFVTTDYLAKKCVKINDVEQKNEYNIGKVIAKDPHAKMAFDNDPQLQNSKEGDHFVVISCHPYDIIGMSTGRAWDKQSCMRLDDGRVNIKDAGLHSSHVANDVAEGTLVAYAISTSDTNIQKPKCRCLLKPFRNDNGGVLYQRETNVYGNKVPGFTAVLNKFIRQINAKVPAGFYELVTSLYNDGIRYSITHDPESRSGITEDEVFDDPDLILDFVQQELAEGNANSILDLFIGLSQHQDAIKQSQMDEVIDLIRDKHEVSSVFSNMALTEELPPLVAQIGRAAGYFEKFKDLDVTSKHIKALNKLAVVKGSAYNLMIKNLDDALKGDADDIDFTYYDFIRGILNGAKETPDIDTLKEYPTLYSTIYTAASAVRFMTLENNIELQEGAYALLERIDEPPTKMRGSKIIKVLEHIGGNILVLGFFLDNKNPSDDELYEIDVNEMARYLKGRRIFRAFDRQNDPQIKTFMNKVKVEQFKTIISSPAVVRDMYKHNFEAIRKYMEENESIIQSFKWNADTISALVDFHAPLTMVINYPINDLDKIMNRVFEKFVEFEGKLKPQTLSAKFFVRTMIEAGKLFDKPIHLDSKFEIGESDLLALASKYKTMSKGQKLSQVLSQAEYKGMLPNIANSKDLLILEAPDSFGELDAKHVIKDIGLLMRYALELPNIYDAINSILNIVGACKPSMLPDKDDLVYEKVVDFLTDDDSTNNRLYEEATKEAELEIKQAIKENAERIDTLRHIASKFETEKDALDLFKGYSGLGKNVIELRNNILEALRFGTQQMNADQMGA